MNSIRDLRYDGLKFLMMYCVVLGHLGYNDYGLDINKIIYAFHMPVFVFLSGYFTSIDANRNKRIKWLKKTFVIYIFAQLTLYLLRNILDCFVGRLEGYSVSVSLLSWDIIVIPELALWYLVCLVYWRVFMWEFFNVINDLLLLTISLVLALVIGFIPVDEAFAFQRAFAFFPFFVLGAIFKNRDLIKQLERWPMGFTALAFSLGLIASTFLPTYLPILHYTNWHQLVWRMLQTMLGLCLCLLIVRLSRCKFIEWFGHYGEHTMWIYIGHIYFIILGWKLFPHFGITLNLITAVLLAIIYCVFLIFLSRLIGKK